MLYLKQSTAATIKLGPFLDEDDGKTAETGLTLSQADFRLSKNGGDFAQKNESSSGTHDELGYYDVALDTTDTNTLGRLLIAVQESGALPVWKEFMVVTANVYDSLVGGSDYLDVNAAQIEGVDPNVLTAWLNTCSKDTAQAGSSSTITLAAGESSVDDYYKGFMILLDSGTGAQQAPRLIVTYNGTTKIASISPDFITAPTSGTGYVLFPGNNGDFNNTQQSTLQSLFNNNYTAISTAIMGEGSMDLITLAAMIEALNNISASEVNAEVSDVLKTDTISQLAAGAPTGTPTFESAIMRLYMALVERLDVLEDFKKFYNAAGSVIWKKAITENETQYTEDKGESGP